MPVADELAADPVVEPPVFSAPAGSHPSTDPRVRKASGLGPLLVFLWVSAGLLGFLLLDPDGAFSAWQSLSRALPAAMRAMLTMSCVGLSAHALAIQQRIQYNWKTLVIPLFLIFITVFAGPINGALTQTNELQVPGATDTYFRPAQSFGLSGFGTPGLQEFFEQKYAVAFIVTQGDSSHTHLK